MLLLLWTSSHSFQLRSMTFNYLPVFIYSPPDTPLFDKLWSLKGRPSDGDHLSEIFKKSIINCFFFLLPSSVILSVVAQNTITSRYNVDSPIMIGEHWKNKPTCRPLNWSKLKASIILKICVWPTIMLVRKIVHIKFPSSGSLRKKLRPISRLSFM